MEVPLRPENEGGIGWFFNHLPAILWQRKYYVIISFLLLSVAAAIGAYMLPTIYRSTATLLVQSQDLPTSLVDSPVNGAIEQRIARIRERVLSRGDLITLIEANDLYSKERQTKPMSTVIAKMRTATSVGALAGDIGQSSGQTSNTIAINMSFDYPEPAKAQAVLQSYVNSFLKMDNEDVEDQASLSVRFLQDQAGKLQSQVTELEGQITALKARNGSALAGSGGPTMIDTGSYTAQIANLESQNRQLLAQSTGKTPGVSSAIVDAQMALAAARAKYADTHPDVQAARERLQMVTQAVKSTATPVDDGGLIRSQIAANNAAIGSLVQSRNDASARAAAAMAGSSRAPAIQEQAMQLENRASALRGQYNKVADDLLKAQNGSRMASEQRAERLSLVEPPNLPDKPESPNRPLLMAAGALGGLGLGLLLALGAELLGRPMRSPAQIANMGLPVLGVVPKIDPIKHKGSRFAFFKRRDRQLA